MGKTLIDKVSEFKGKSLKENGITYRGIGRVRKLTQKAMKSIQGLYGGAICDHPGDVVAMRNAIWAIWLHRGRDLSKDGMSCPAVSPDEDLERANKTAQHKSVQTIGLGR